MESQTILHGDCLSMLKGIGPSTVDLVYLDPPFNTRKARKTNLARFADSWPSIESYIDFMRPRIEACLQVLHDDGVILLHCDWRTSHHLRILLEDLLGPDAFINHLVWHYGLGGSSPRRFARKHDDILFYAKSGEYYFDPPRVPATSERMRGQMKKATDVLSIAAINNMAHERTGYPTQKPISLLRLLIEACCPPGGLVVDPFCGSGTTVVAALQSGRRAVGIDVSQDAVSIATARCTEVMYETTEA